MEKKLQRNEQEKMIAGVCAGLADYFDVDVSWVRIAFVLAVMAGFSGLVAYIILWIAVPPRPFTPDFGKYDADYKVYENKAYSDHPVSDPSFTGTPFIVPEKRGKGRMIAGVLFVTFGLFFLLNEFDLIPYWFDMGKLWPVILIVIGIYTLLRSGKKEPWKQKTQQKTQQETPQETALSEPTIDTSANTDESPSSAVETKSDTDQTTNTPL